MRTITTITNCALLAACALLALALATACTPHAADDPAAAHPVPLMPTATLAQATTAQPTRGAVVSRLSSFGKEEYPDRGEVVGKATRTTTRASVPITLTSGTLNLTMNGVENPYTLSANGALTSTTPHSVIGTGTRTFVVDEAKVTATTASPDITGITGIAPGLTPTNASLPMNLGVVMPSQELPVAADGAVALPLVHTTAGMRLILKVDDGVSLSAVLSLLSGEEAPTKDAVDANPSMPTNTDSRIVALTGTSTYVVAFGMLPPATAINAGDLLATITTKTHGSSITKTLALLAPATLSTPLNAGDMVTYTVHVGKTLATITSVSITGFASGNGTGGEDIGVGDKDAVIATGLEDNLTQLLTAATPVWMITGTDKAIIGKVKAVLNAVAKAEPAARIHLQMPNFAGEIGFGGFSDCTVLASISAPKITVIGTIAFSGCTALTTVSLPAAITIEEYAFWGCTSLTTVSLPTVTGKMESIIAGNAFEECTSLTTISLPAVTGEITGKDLIGIKGFAHISLPAVTSIGSSAFKDFANLISIDLPAVTGNIGGSAFQNCASLTSISLPAATDIGGSAFWGCASLTGISFPLATNIGEGAFLGCTNLASIDLPAATSIGGSAFKGCASLAEISLPEVTSIGGSAFEDCTNLSSIDLPKLTSIDEFSFSGCASLTDIILPNVTGVIGYRTFGGCTSLTTIRLTGITGSIGDYAFEGCTSLTTVDLPNTTGLVGSWAFDGCTSLAEISLPGATGINDWAFANCVNLVTMKLTQSTEPFIVRTYAFGNNTDNSDTKKITLTLHSKGALGSTSVNVNGNEVLFNKSGSKFTFAAVTYANQ